MRVCVRVCACARAREQIEASRAAELRQLALIKYLDAGCVYLWATTSLLFT